MGPLMDDDEQRNHNAVESTMGRKARIAFALAGTAAGGSYAYGCVDEGVGRSQTYWARAFPIYMKYRWVQFLNKDMKMIDDEEATRRYEALHDVCAPLARDLCFELRGFYLKNAQMMSTRDDFFPPQYIKWMKETEDQAPTPFQEGDAEKVVEEELGRPLDEVFEYFDPKPVGVASIGQVHRAILKGGQEVAVKVQHNGAERIFRGDLATVKGFCEKFQPQHVPAFDEMEKQHVTEFNYRLEAENLELVRQQIMPKWGDQVCIPKAHLDLCTQRVLTMEFLKGKKLVDGVRDSYRSLAAKMGTTLEEMEDEQRRKIKSGELQLQSIEQETKKNINIRRYLLVKDYIANALRMLMNFTPIPYAVSLLRHGKVTPFAMEWTEIPLDLGAIMKILIDVHGEQMFTHGSFNGDPHPGNVMLLEDGRIGLIDYGQVKHLGEHSRKSIAEIMVALRDDKRDLVAEKLQQLGSKTKYGRKDIGYRLAAFWFDRDTDDIMTVDGTKLNIAELLDYCEAQDPVEQVPDDLVLPGRCLVLLRGMGMAFGMRISLAQMVAPTAEKYLATLA